MMIKSYTFQKNLTQFQSFEPVSDNNITNILSKNYANSVSFLNFSSPFEKSLGICLEFLENNSPYTTLGLLAPNNDLKLSIKEKSYNNVHVLGLVAGQIYYEENSQEEKDFKVNLGLIHEDVFSAEPIIRQAELVLLDCNALKKADCPSKINFNPVGLSAEEICQLAFFAGSGVTKIFGVINCDLSSNDSDSQISMLLIDQIRFYFERGVATRSSSNLENEQYLIYYTVHSNSGEIEFVKNDLSNKWWFKNTDNKWIPCHYKDYQSLAENEIISEYLLHYL